MTLHEIANGGSVNYSCVDGGYLGGGSLDLDPSFVDIDGPDDLLGIADDNLLLSPGSPCINLGTNSPAGGLTLTDLGGAPRIVCSIVDMGAHESPVPIGGCAPVFLRGDANGDGLIETVDQIANLTFLFATGPSPCLDTQDTNDDGAVDISDPLFGLGYLFAAGPALPPPFPGCGSDPTLGSLGCETYIACP